MYENCVVCCEIDDDADAKLVSGFWKGKSGVAKK